MNANKTAKALKFLITKKQGDVFVVTSIKERRTLIASLQQIFEDNWTAYKHRIQEEKQGS